VRTVFYLPSGGNFAVCDAFYAQLDPRPAGTKRFVFLSSIRAQYGPTADTDCGRLQHHMRRLSEGIREQGTPVLLVRMRPPSLLHLKT
jgi:hypothetical protein